MKARVILKLRDGSDFSYVDCYEYDDLEKAANDIADEILKKEYVMSWDPFGVSIIPARDIKSIRIDKGFKTISPPIKKTKMYTMRFIGRVQDIPEKMPDARGCGV